MATDDETDNDNDVDSVPASSVPSGVEVVNVDRSDISYRRRGFLVGLAVALPSLLFPLGWASVLAVLIALSGLLHLFSDFGNESGDDEMTPGRRLARTLGRLGSFALTIVAGFVVAAIAGAILGALSALVGGHGGGPLVGAVKAGIIDYGAEWGSFLGCAWYISRRWRTRSKSPLVAPLEQFAMVLDEVSGPPLTVASVVIAVLIFVFALPSHRLWTPFSSEWPVSAIDPLEETLETMATDNAEALVTCWKDGWLTFDGSATSTWDGTRLTVTIRPEWSLDQLDPFIDEEAGFNLTRAGVTLMAAMHNQMAPWVDRVVVVFPPDAPVRPLGLNRDTLPPGTWVKDDLSVLAPGLNPTVAEEPWMDEPLSDAQMEAIAPVCWN